MIKKDRLRNRYYQRKYGISLAQYNQMLARQQNSCALCKKHKSHFSKNLAVDHNHKSGKVRGLLCFYCNKRVVGRHNLESATRLFNYMLSYDE